MRYKIGDKVKIRTWEDMEQEYGLNSYENITTPEFMIFSREKEEELNNYSSNRILTIRGIYNSNHYDMEEIRKWSWDDDMIECLAKDYVEPIPIKTRFEILDL